MREIQFRVYDSKKKVMSHSFDIYGTNAFWIPRGDEFGSLDLRYLEINYDLMQFTGILDKNGINICEGDIVRFDQGKKYTYVIVFVNGSFQLKHTQEHIGLWGLLATATVEQTPSYHSTLGNLIVIGNIHENKDLIIK